MSCVAGTRLLIRMDTYTSYRYTSCMCGVLKPYLVSVSAVSTLEPTSTLRASI